MITQTTDLSQDTRLLNADQVAAILGVKTTTVYDMARKRRIPSIVLGTRIMRFDENEIRKFINRHTIKPIN